MPRQFEVREAEARDAETIAKFNAAMARETEHLELDPQRLLAGVRAMLSDSGKGFYVVACSGDDVIGQLMITYEWSDWRNRLVWWIQSVHVTEAARRRGVFRALYEFVRQEAQSAGAGGLRLYVHTDNTRAQAVYSAIGMDGNHYRVFEDMFVPDDHLLVENDALGKAGVYFRPGKIIQASKNLGVGMRAFELAADYVQNYVQGGRILIKHQAVALRIADMATRLEAVRALLERAARAVDADTQDADTLCNMAKLFASEEILKVAQHCVELHGGNGVMLDFGVEKVLRDAAIFLHMDATVDISKFKIVKSMFPATAGKYAGPE